MAAALWSLESSSVVALRLVPIVVLRLIPVVALRLVSILSMSSWGLSLVTSSLITLLVTIIAWTVILALLSSSSLS